MSVTFYMDVHIRGSVTRQLRIRGVDVLTAQEDGAAELRDPDLLDRSTSLGRVLVSQDDDLLAEATRRQRLEVPFGGVIYSHQLAITIGQMVEDLDLIAKGAESTDFINHVEYLPL